MSDRGWGKPNFLVNAQDFYKMVDKVEGRTQVTNLRKVLRNTAKKVYIPSLKSASPKGDTGKLRASWGTITGKSRYQATMFVGPRVPRGYRLMSDEKKKAQKYGGWVSNILEFAKTGRRYPKNGKFLKTPWGPRTSVGPIKRRTRFRAIMKSKSKTALADMARGVEQLIFK